MLDLLFHSNRIPHGGTLKISSNGHIAVPAQDVVSQHCQIIIAEVVTVGDDDTSVLQLTLGSAEVMHKALGAAIRRRKAAIKAAERQRAARFRNL